MVCLLRIAGKCSMGMYILMCICVFISFCMCLVTFVGIMFVCPCVYVPLFEVLFSVFAYSFFSVCVCSPFLRFCFLYLLIPFFIFRVYMFPLFEVFFSLFAYSFIYFRPYTLGSVIKCLPGARFGHYGFCANTASVRVFVRACSPVC